MLYIQCLSQGKLTIPFGKETDIACKQFAVIDYLNNSLQKLDCCNWQVSA